VKGSGWEGGRVPPLFNRTLTTGTNNARYKAYQQPAMLICLRVNVVYKSCVHMLRVYFTRFSGDLQELRVAMVKPVQEQNQNSSPHPMVVKKPNCCA